MPWVCSFYEIWTGARPWHIQEETQFRPNGALPEHITAHDCFSNVIFCFSTSVPHHAHPAVSKQACACADTWACLGCAATGYTEVQLHGIMATREKLWHSECMLSGGVPHFLRSWRRYVLSLGPLDVPDYGMLRRLLFDCTREPAHTPPAWRAEAWEASPGLEGMSGLLAAMPHVSPVAKRLRSQAPCQHMQRHCEQTPKPMAAHDPIAAGAPGLQRLPRNKRMRPGSDAEQPDVWDAVAKRLCSEAFASDLAHEE